MVCGGGNAVLRQISLDICYYQAASLLRSGVLVSFEFRRLSVCLSVSNDREFWKNGRFDRDAISGGGRVPPL